MFEGHKAATQMIHKIVSELMVLGLISFGVVLVIQFESGSELVEEVLAEFEMAHVWLFSVGLLYVVNAVTFMYNLKNIKKSWDRFDSMHTTDLIDEFRMDSTEGDSNDQQEEDEDKVVVVQDEKNLARPESLSGWKWKGIRRPVWKYLLCGSGSDASAIAEFKCLKLYFIQQHWAPLKHELGSDEHVKRFDYSQYMRTVVTEEIVELLEVAPSTWAFFLVFLWILYGLRAAAGLAHDNAVVLPSVVMAWLLFFFVLALLIESHLGMLRLHALIPGSFGIPLSETGGSIEHTFEQLAERHMFHGGIKPAAGKASLDTQGNIKHRSRSTFIPVKENDDCVRPRKSTYLPPIEARSLSAAAGDDVVGTEMIEIEQKVHREPPMRKEANSRKPKGNDENSKSSTTSRNIRRASSKAMKSVSTRITHFAQTSRTSLARLSKISPRQMSQMSNLIMFLQCFMIG